jgi:hypothetical protein
VRANFDAYNFLNGVSILTINSNYGSQWRLPSGPMLTVPFRPAGRWLSDVSVSGVAFWNSCGEFIRCIDIAIVRVYAPGWRRRRPRSIEEVTCEFD